MELIETIQDIQKPLKNAVITIGNFDGVHIGHQALFHEVIEQAAAISGTSVAMTFEPHPIRVLTQNNHPPLMTLYEQKVELIESSGIDMLIIIPFTQEFASMSAKAFIQDLLIGRIGMKAVVVGKDYTFGRDREGNLNLLKTFAQEFDFEITVADWVSMPREGVGRISSTKIRQLVTEGRVRKARKMLGRHYQIRGTVITGRNRGGKYLGFPTANIKLNDELCPKTGVYAVTVQHHGKRYNGVANIGFSPTFDDHIFTVEVYILDFEEDIYGQKIRVNFVKRLRDEKKFSSITELAGQIQNDVKEARAVLL